MNRPVFGRKIAPQAVKQSPPIAALTPMTPSPVDPSPAPQITEEQRMLALEDSAIAELETFVERTNATLPARVRVIPYAMLPWSLWDARNTPFLLYVCKMIPQSGWNQMLLPENEMSSAILGLPQHPRSYPPGFDDQLTTMLSQLTVAMDMLRERMQANPEMIALGESEMRKQIQFAAQTKVLQLAHFSAKMLLGEDVFSRHYQLFGEALSQWEGAAL